MVAMTENLPPGSSSCGRPRGRRDANRLLAPFLRLPELPVIRCPPAPFEPRDKLPAVIGSATGLTRQIIDECLSRADGNGIHAAGC